jgi:hypothetical protein
MSITLSQAGLVDEKSKNRHVEETGYDYLKQVQSHMRLFVENNLKFEEMLRLTTLVPKVGITNGITITEEDRNAYIAAHPQNAAPKSQRQTIAELLQSGGSTLDNVPTQQETNESVLDIELHKRFPPIPAHPTHYAIIETPGYSKPIEENENIYRIIDASERLTLIDQFRGKQGDFHFVKSEDPSYKPFYILSTKVLQLDDNARLSPFDLNEPNASPTGGTPQDWVFQPTGVPYNSPETGEKRIVVALDREVLPDNEREQVLEEGFREGITEILKAESKNYTEEYIQRELIDSQNLDKPAQATEIFLSQRDGLGVLVLVKIPIANLTMLEDAPPELAWQFTEDYRTESFKELSSILEKKIHSVGDGIDGYNGQVTVFESFKEAKKIENLPADINSLARQNGIDGSIFDKKGLIQFYWNSEMKPVIIEFQPDDEEKKYNLVKGLQEFTQKFSIISKRTQSLLLSMQNIVAELDSSWEDFLSDWVQFEEVRVIPEGQEVVPPEEKEGPPVKTEEQKRKEDNYYGSSERRIAEHGKRKKMSESSGSPLVEPDALTRVLDQLGNDDDGLYESFLNNVDFRKIMMDATSCLLSGMDVSSFNSIHNDFKVLKNEYDKIKKDWRESRTLKFLYPDDNPTDDISEAFFNTLGETLGSMVSSVISSTIKNVINSLLSVCPDKKNEIGTPAKVVPDFPFNNLQSTIDDLFGEGRVPLGVISSIFDDLANLLSPSELCNLLRGEPDPITVRLVKTLLHNSYCELGLDTTEEIVNFFISLSSAMDLSICDEIDDLTEYISDDFLCPPTHSLRERLLSDKGMSPEEIKKQIDRESARAREMAEQFLKDLTDGIASGKFRTPNLFCSKDSEGNIIAGQTSFMDDQFKVTLESTIVSIFKPTYESFSEEGEKYVQSLYVERETEMSGIKNPFTGIEIPDLKIPVREPVPQLTKFYKNPLIENSSIESDNSFSITIPTNAEGTLAETRAIASLENPNPEPTRCDDGSSDGTIESILQNISSGLEGTRGIEKIVFKEVDSCTLIENEIAKNTFKVLEFETTNEASSSAPPKQETPLLTNSCGDELVPFAQTATSFSNPIQQTITTTPEITQPASTEAQGYRTFIKPGTPTLDGCESKNEIGYIIAIGEEKMFKRKVVDSSHMDFLEEKSGKGTRPNSFTFFSAVLQEALSDPSPEQVKEFQALVKTESPSILKEVRNNVLEMMFGLVQDSPYLRKSPTDASVALLDYINLGPVGTKECDLHLLRIGQVIKDLMENFQDELCLDLDQPEKGGKPRMTPLEKEMMKACVKTTIRHYTIEVLSTGLLSASLQGRQRELEDMKVEYIADKIKRDLISYPDNYYNDFIESAQEVFEGMGTGGELLQNLIKQEFKFISSGFYDSLMLKEGQLSMRERIMESIPEVESTTNSSGERLLVRRGSDSIDDISFVYVVGEDNRRIFSLVLRSVGDLEGFEQATFTSSSSSTFDRYLLPLFDMSDPPEEKGKKDLLTDVLFDLCFPIEEYSSTIAIHEMLTVSRVFDVVIAFGETRDNLYSCFYAVLPEKDDWKKQDKSLKAVGGSSGLTKMWDYNFGIRNVPCSQFAFNGGMDVCWGDPFKGLGFTKALRIARDAALLEFKKFVERNDPAVRLAARLSFLSKLACVNIPTSAIAAAINTNPLTAAIMPLTPSAATYHALGLGIFAPNQNVSSDSTEGSKARTQIKVAGLKLPPHCGDYIDDTERLEEQARQEGQAQQQARLEEQQQEILESLTPEQREYYNSIIGMTKQTLGTQIRELEDSLFSISASLREFTDNRSNYTVVGKRDFDNGGRNPESLLPTPAVQWSTLKIEEDRVNMNLNISRMRYNEL